MLSVVLGFAVTASTYAAERFVSLSGSHVPPFTGWASAATNIQDAIDASADGDTVWVTNGVYASGGKVMAGDLTNRIAIDKQITVRSVNGPWVTTILGAGPTNGNAAVRCAWLTNNAALHGFTLKWGATRTAGDSTTLLRGGGVWCASSEAAVVNCVIRTNTAAGGGGAYRGTIRNSLLSSNVSSVMTGGAGAYDATLINCTVVSNAGYGIVASVPGAATATNCILYFNAIGSFFGTPHVQNSCTIQNPINGSSNITANPLFFVDGIQLQTNSPCRSAGLNIATGLDLFGRAWATPPSMGCAEVTLLPMPASPVVRLTSDPVGFEVSVSTFNGEPPLSLAWLKDGVPLTNDTRVSNVSGTNLIVSGVRSSDAGGYSLVASNSWGAVTSLVATVVIRFVDPSSANPALPYDQWATAASSLQQAIDAAMPGEIILVTNGVFATGGRVVSDGLTNRVVINKAVLVHSVNGPEFTAIQGAIDPASTNGPTSVRCAWLTTNAILSGFTLSGGSTLGFGGNGAVYGGGAWCPSTNAVLVNCIVTNNSARTGGGGVFQVVARNSRIAGNSGGGAYRSLLINCSLSGNTLQSGYGSAAHQSRLINCSVTGNISLGFSASIYQGSLVNCTITGNSLQPSGPAIMAATLTNCIVWNNRTSSGQITNVFACTGVYNCTDLLIAGDGNITSDPQLLGDGVHLSKTSPCRGTGLASVLQGTDIDSQPWSDGAAIGCDGWGPEPIIVLAPSTGLKLDTPVALNISCAEISGDGPFATWWEKDGLTIPAGPHYSFTTATTIVVNAFGPADAGSYRLIASNTFGVSTSAVVNVSVHCADAANGSPAAPYLSWNTAASTLQDAVDAAPAGAYVLVTNGVYASGGKVKVGDLLNRVAIDKPVTVASVNGRDHTVIRGAFDPVSTNGPLAVRCVWMDRGAVLAGFTVTGGATRTSGGDSSRSGGGIWAAGTTPAPDIVACRILSNSADVQGGGVFYGRISNSIIEGNSAYYGGGVAISALHGCLVIRNRCTLDGGGAYKPRMLANSTVVQNTGTWGGGVFYEDISVSGRSSIVNSIIYGNTGGYSINYNDIFIWDLLQSFPTNSCIGVLPFGLKSLKNGSISANPQFTDDFHLAVTSPCRNAGLASAAPASDLDGEPFAMPPSMGCDEVIESNIAGPLSVSFLPQFSVTTPVAGVRTWLLGSVQGRATQLAWDFGDGTIFTNETFLIPFHTWTNPGDYTVTLTAFNADHPQGVSDTRVLTVVPIFAPELSFGVDGPKALIDFAAQPGVSYDVQRSESLSPPAWQRLWITPPATNNQMRVEVMVGTNATMFYRLRVYRDDPSVQ